MLLKNYFAVLPLLLSGCGVSVFAHVEYVRFSDVDDAVMRERELSEREGLILKKIFSNQKEESISEKDILSVGDIKISFEEKVYGAVGLFPLIPPPPYIPVFFNILGSGCSVSSDVNLSIRYALDMAENKKIQDYIKIKDNHSIYLIKESDDIILPRQLWNDGYAYQICFPLKLEEIDGVVLNINGLTKAAGGAISVPLQKLRYYNDNGLMIGYWGM